LRCNFLIRSVGDTLARELLPIARPVAAEPAIAVVDQKRARAGCRWVRGCGGLIRGCLLHNFNLDRILSRVRHDEVNAHSNTQAAV